MSRLDTSTTARASLHRLGRPLYYTSPDVDHNLTTPYSVTDATSAKTTTSGWRIIRATTIEDSALDITTSDSVLCGSDDLVRLFSRSIRSGVFDQPDLRLADCAKRQHSGMAHCNSMGTCQLHHVRYPCPSRLLGANNLAALYLSFS